MTRDEHMAWCKTRAIECLDRSGVSDAFASMGSDLGKHPETAGHSGIELGVMLLMGGHLSTKEDMRRYIDGFN